MSETTEAASGTADREGGARGDEGDATRDAGAVRVHDPDAASDDDGLSDRQGWALVGVLVACFVGFPLAILAWPPTFLPYHDAYLALALVPGLLMGAVGVWSALRTA